MPTTIFEKTLAELEANPFATVLGTEGDCIIDIEVQPGCGVYANTKETLESEEGVLVTCVLGQGIVDEADLSDCINQLCDLTHECENLVVFMEDIPEDILEQKRELFDAFVDIAQARGDVIVNRNS